MASLLQEKGLLRSGDVIEGKYIYAGTLELVSDLDHRDRGLHITQGLQFSEVHQALNDELAASLSDELIAKMRLESQFWTLISKPPSNLTLLFLGDGRNFRNDIGAARSTLVLERTAFKGSVTNEALSLGGTYPDQADRMHVVGGIFNPRTTLLYGLEISATEQEFPQDIGASLEAIFNARHDNLQGKPAGLLTKGMLTLVTNGGSRDTKFVDLYDSTRGAGKHGLRVANQFHHGGLFPAVEVRSVGNFFSVILASRPQAGVQGWTLNFPKSFAGE